MRTLLFISCLLAVIAAKAQMAINNDGSLPDNSAMLEVKSSSKGLLIPSMTMAQRNAVTAPANGLMVFQTDNSPGFYYNSGSSSAPAWILVGASGGWKLTGNSGTNPTVNFLGTTDNIPLKFRVSNLTVGIIDPVNNNTAFGKQSMGLITSGNYNASFGSSALANTLAGQYNAAIGYSAALQNNSGSENTAIGANTLLNNTTGNRNIAAGMFTLSTNTTGSSNIAIGTRSLKSNTTKNNVMAIGDSALFMNGTDASQAEHATCNTAVGSMAQYANTTGNGNTSAGRMSLAGNTTGNYNTINGVKTMHSNTTGSSNTAIGIASLYYNTTGSGNTANGFGVLYNINEGSYNTVGGMFSSFSITTGSQNTALGYYSLSPNITGNGNISIGQQSLATNVTGNYNTAIGIYALGYTNSDYNTGAGFNSGGGYAFNQGTCMGAYAYPEANSLANCLAMGIDARVDASNKYVIGKWSVTSIGGYANWTTFSDGRFKKNVLDNAPGLAFINRLNPVTYTLDLQALSDHFTQNEKSEMFQDRPWTIKTNEDSEKGVMVYTGLIAQEVLEAALQSGYDFSGVDPPGNETDLYRLRYEEFVVPLVKAIQELDQRKDANIKAIQELKKRIENLENK